MTVAKQIWSLLRGRERWQLALLTAFVLVAAVLETVGVASVLPFMQLVANPDAVRSDPYLALAFDRLGFASVESFLVFAGVALLVMVALANGTSALTVWLTQRFAWAQNHRLSVRLLRAYMAEPYAFFLRTNTAGLSRTLLQEVGNAITGVVVPALTLVARGVVCLMIAGLLAFMNPLLTLLLGGILGGAYLLVYVVFRRRQHRLGQERMRDNLLRFKVAGEGLTGIKIVKVLGREGEFIRRFREPSWRFSMATASNRIVSLLPRYVLETLVFGSVIVVLLYFLETRGDVGAVLPVLTLYVFAGYRLMPAMNQVFSSVVQMRFNRPALDTLCRDLQRAPSNGTAGAPTAGASTAGASPARATAPAPMEVGEGIRLEGISFRYDGAAEPALRGIDLEIPKNAAVGLVGSTGSGKTTLVDLLLGLLEPSDGAVLVNGRRLTASDLPAWQRTCGYVPQDVFLCDDSIAANIAFGMAPEEIDMAAVERAGRAAQIHEFIQTLPEGYDTKVGERGVRLSGGQRQRIGIARALYHDPAVLIMDEATSSLDGRTEKAVIDTINQLAKKKTMVVIAHRLATVRRCDWIYMMDAGRVAASGRYEDLCRESDAFRSMAGIGADSD